MTGSYLKSFDGAKIYYHKTIRNPDKWLIFLHGMGGDLTAWSNEREYFSKHNISTIALDLRGHGLSDRSDNQDFYKIENFAGDVAVLIEKEKIKNLTIVGHCFGGVISMYFQNLYPHYSQGLVLVDTSYKPPFFGEKPVTKFFYDHLFKLMALIPDIKLKNHANLERFIGTGDLNVRRIASDILHTSLKSYFLTCETFLNIDAKELLGKIMIPTLVIEGDKDSIFPPEIAEYIKNRIKNSEIEFIKGANHIIVINNPKQLAESILKFLDKLKF